MSARSTIVVTDSDDPAVADYRSLRGAGSRRREVDLGHVVVEGRLALERALDGPLRLRSVLVTPSRHASLADLLQSLPEEVQLFVADRDVLQEITGFDVHRGVLASAHRPRPLDPAELLRGCRRVAVLEGLTDLENLGATFRVAAALGLDAVLLDDRCADPLYRRCVRVSLGWSTVIPHARLGPLPHGLGSLTEAGMRTVALTPGAFAVAVDDAAARGLLDDPVALLVGAEGPGLEADTIAAADHAVAIPMGDGVDSLNAATALAVVAAFAAANRGWS